MVEIALLLLVVVAVVAVLLWAASLNFERANKRRQLLRHFAQSNGWTWTGEDTSLTQRWTGPPFGIGHERRAQNVVRGWHNGRPVAFFDYSYQTRTSDRTETTHLYGVCVIGLPTELPRLEVLHENSQTRFGRVLGLEDIDLESEDFNRRFRVSCTERKFASDVLHPRLMTMLLSRGSVSWRIEGTDLLCWADNQHSPDQVLASLRLLDEILDGIPSFVWRDRGVTLERTGEPSS